MTQPPPMWLPEDPPEPEPAAPPPQYRQPYARPYAQPYAQPDPQPYAQQYAQPYPQPDPQPYPQPDAQPYAQSSSQPHPESSYPQPHQQPYAQPYEPYQQSYGEPYPQPYPQSYPPSFPQPYPTPFPSPSFPGMPPRQYVPPPRRNPLTTVGIVAAVLVVVLIVGGNVWNGPRGSRALGANHAGEVVIASVEDLPRPRSTGRDHPTPGFEESGGPLGTPTGPVTASDEFAFQQVQDSGTDEPVAWSPCRPIHVVVNLDGAPPDFEDQVISALGELSVASGLVFVYDGITDEAPDDARDAYQPLRYGDRWVPVLIQFADDTEIPDLDGDVMGLTISHMLQAPYSDSTYIVSAEVFLDDDVLRAQGARGLPAYVAVLRHELGHVVGLDHVDDDDELMYPWTVGVVNYQDGDRAGLAELGQGPCMRDL